MSLTEFLEARIAEDEDVARDAQAAEIHTVAHEHMERWDPPRVLAECAAKRALVDYYLMLVEQSGQSGGAVSGYHATGLGIALRALASVYADHPDYLPEWKP